VLAIPPKRFDRRTIDFLTADESQALINATPLARWEGRRDRAMLTLALHTGLRVSELDRAGLPRRSSPDRPARPLTPASSSARGVASAVCWSMNVITAGSPPTAWSSSSPLMPVSRKTP
jgi:hypothetical protein